MVNDPIGDFLTRIRNAQLRKKESVEIPATKMLVSIAEILKEEKFISDFEVKKDNIQDIIEIKLRYVNEEPTIKELKRVSKPGIRKYRGYREIKPIKNGMGLSIFSTPRGVMTGNNAIKQKIGGEYICEIY